MLRWLAHTDLIGRFGGEEFLFLFSIRPNGSCQLMDELRDAFSQS
jgi:PleD family two-component response regulator